MTWWEALVLIVGIAGGEFVLLRLLPWGKNWDAAGYF